MVITHSSSTFDIWLLASWFPFSVWFVVFPFSFHNYLLFSNHAHFPGDLITLTTLETIYTLATPTFSPSTCTSSFKHLTDYPVPYLGVYLASKLNISRTELLVSISPSTLFHHLIFPLVHLKNLGVILDSFSSHLTSNLAARFVDSIFKLELNLISTATVQACVMYYVAYLSLHTLSILYTEARGTSGRQIAPLLQFS